MPLSACLCVLFVILVSQSRAATPVLTLGVAVRDTEGDGQFRSFTYTHQSSVGFVVSAIPITGDVALQICNSVSSVCLISDDTGCTGGGTPGCPSTAPCNARVTETISISPGLPIWGGIYATYIITAFARGNKKSHCAASYSYVDYLQFSVVAALSAGSPAASAAPSSLASSTVVYEAFFGTSIYETVGGAAGALKRAFKLQPTAVSANGFTLTMQVVAGPDATVSLGLVAPDSDTSDWTPYLSATTNVGSAGGATVTLPVPPSINANLGFCDPSIATIYNGGVRTYMYILVVPSVPGAATSFVLSAETDGGGGAAASPTPTPSPSALPLGLLLPPGALPLTLGMPYSDSVAVGYQRTYTYQHAASIGFDIRGVPITGDVDLLVCSSGGLCLHSDDTGCIGGGTPGCPYTSPCNARVTEMIPIAPGMPIWGGIGATYTITVTARGDKKSSCTASRAYIDYLRFSLIAELSVGSPTVSAAPSPLASSVTVTEIFMGGSVNNQAGGVTNASFVFKLQPVASVVGGFTVQVQILTGEDAQVSLALIPPDSDTSDWHSHAVATTSVSTGNPIAYIPILPNTSGYLGWSDPTVATIYNGGIYSYYYFRVVCIGPPASTSTFQILASTRSPSPSPSFGPSRAPSVAPPSSSGAPTRASSPTSGGGSGGGSSSSSSSSVAPIAASVSPSFTTTPSPAPPTPTMSSIPTLSNSVSPSNTVSPGSSSSATYTPATTRTASTSYTASAGQTITTTPSASASPTTLPSSAPAPYAVTMTFIFTVPLVTVDQVRGSAMFAAAAEGDFSDALRVNISWVSVNNANVIYNTSGSPVGVQTPMVITIPVISSPGGIMPAQALANATDAASTATLYLKALFAGGATQALLPRTYDYIAYITQTPPGLIPAPGVNTNPSINPPTPPAPLQQGNLGTSSLSPGAKAAVALIVVIALVGCALYALWPRIASAWRRGGGARMPTRTTTRKVYEIVDAENPVVRVTASANALHQQS